MRGGRLFAPLSKPAKLEGIAAMLASRADAPATKFAPHGGPWLPLVLEIVQGSIVMAIRLLIVDDHPVIRVGLRQLLAGGDVQVVAEATDGLDAIETLKKHKVDVVLLDVRMPVCDGLGCLEQLRSIEPTLPVLMFSGYANPSFIAKAIALRASGYLTKDVDRETLLETIRKAAAGSAVWSPEDVHRASSPTEEPHPEAELEIPLTKRESEVLKQLAFGQTNKQIAQTLGISYETVKEHVQHILSKLGVSDRTQAAVWAVRMGIV